MPVPPDDRDVDLLLVGGGLANGLIALRMAQQRPEVSVRIVEADDRLGGRHTWSFFGTDLTADQREWIAPLVAHRWPGYAVRFPTGDRRLSTPYNTTTSDRLNAVVSRLPELRLDLGVRATAVRPDGVALADGRDLKGGFVIDGRGPSPSPDLVLGFQKFVGVEVRVAEPHGLAEPIVMDARVDQLGGYRFLYTLPLDDRTLLIEDTRYTDGPDLDRSALRQGALDYAQAQGWTVAEVVREEEGVLPVALDGDLAAHLDRQGDAAQSGLKAGLFHPTTGYSLPDAVRLADHLAASWPAVSAAGLRRRALDVWQEREFYRLLNRLLFRAAEPEERYRVLQRFHRLAQPLIERFYGGRTTLADKARILVGKPPVPIGRAIGVLTERGRA